MQKGPYSPHFIFFGAYEWAQKARVFVHGRPFHYNLMFGRKAEMSNCKLLPFYEYIFNLCLKKYYYGQYSQQ